MWLLQVFREILKKFEKEENVQDGIKLISHIENKEKMSVIKFAVKMRALKLVEELLNFTNIMRFDRPQETVYDITDLVPESGKNLLLGSSSIKTPNSKSSQIAPEPQEKEKEDSKQVADVSSTEAAVTNETKQELNVKQFTQSTGQKDNITTETPRDEDRTKKRSFMELIIELISEFKENDTQLGVVELFESNPVKLFVNNTFGSFCWFGRILLILHLTHMFLFAAYALPNAKELIVQSSCVRLPPSNHGPKVFWIWPAFVTCLLLFDIIRVKRELCIIHLRVKECLKEIKCCSCCCCYCCRCCCSCFCKCVISLPELIAALVSFVLSPAVITLAFNLASFVWCAYGHQCVARETLVYLTAAVLIFGWMSTFYFAKLAIFITYDTIMKYYNFSYILCFILLYSYALLGFGLAFDVLFQLSDKMINATYQPWKTLISAFQLSFGDGDPLQSISDKDFFGTYSDDGGDPGLVYFVYIIYVLGTAVLLINIFNASLTNTTEKPLMTKWSVMRRVHQLTFCYCILSKMPRMLEICDLFRPYRIEAKDGRLQMYVRKQPIIDRNDLLHDIHDLLLKQLAKGMSRSSEHRTLTCGLIRWQRNNSFIKIVNSIMLFYFMKIP